MRGCSSINENKEGEVNIVSVCPRVRVVVCVSLLFCVWDGIFPRGKFQPLENRRLSFFVYVSTSTRQKQNSRTHNS